MTVNRTARNRHRTRDINMSGGQRARNRFIRTTMDSISGAVRALRAMAQMTQLERSRSLDALRQKALNNSKKTTATPPAPVDSKTDTTRDIALGEKMAAVSQAKATVSKAPIDTALTQSSDLGALDVAGIVVPLLKPAQPNIDTAAAIVQLQMNTLAEDAMKQLQAVQSAELAEIIRKRTEIAITALAKKLDIAKLQQLKHELSSVLNADIVIGQIINDTLAALFAAGDATSAAQTAYETTHTPSQMATVQTELTAKAEEVNSDIYNLIGALIISRGNVSELTQMLASASSNLSSKMLELTALETEGSTLQASKAIKDAFLKAVINDLRALNSSISGLSAQLATINLAIETAVFDPGSEYSALINLKAATDASAKAMQDAIRGLNSYLSKIDPAASFAILNNERATKEGVTSAIEGALSAALGADMAALQSANTEYAIANNALQEAGANLTAATDGSEGPTQSALETSRGDMPSAPTPSAPPIEQTLRIEQPKIDGPVGFATSLETLIAQAKGDMLIFQAQQATMQSNLDEIIAKRDEINGIIAELKRLSTDSTTSEADMLRIDGDLQGIIASLALIIPSTPDRTALTDAETALAQLNMRIFETEQQRQQSITTMITLKSRIDRNTAELLKAQSLLDMKMIQDQRGRTDTTSPELPATAILDAIALAIARDTAQIEALRGQLITNIAALRAALSDLGLASEGDRARLDADIAAHKVATIDAVKEAQARADIAEGTTALAAVTSARDAANGDISIKYASMQEAKAALDGTALTVSSLQDSILPGLVTLRGILSQFSNKTFSFIVDRKLFAESLNIFTRSSSDTSAFYAAMKKAALTTDSASADASRAEASQTVTAIKDNNTSSDLLNARIDGLKSDLANNDLSDTSVIAIVSNLVDIQTEAITNMMEASQAVTSLSATIADSSQNLLDVKAKLTKALQDLQNAIDMMVNLGDFKSKVNEIMTGRNTTDGIIAQQQALSRSHEEALSAATGAKQKADQSATTPPSKDEITGTLARLREMQAAATAAEQQQIAADILAIYNGMKDDADSIMNGKAALEDFFRSLGTDFQNMQQNKADLMAKLADLQSEMLASELSKERMAKLEALLDGAEAIDTNMLLRDADIAKLIGLAEAQIEMKQEAAAAATEAATIAETDPSKDDIADSIGTLESTIARLNDLLYSKNTTEDQKKKIENEIARLRQELINIGKNINLQRAKAKLELLQKEKDDLQKKIDEEKNKLTVDDNLLRNLQMEMTALNTAIESTVKEIAKIKDDIAKNKAINEDARNKETLLERLKSDLKPPPINANLASMLGIAGLGLGAIVGAVGLGGLLANLPNLGGKTDALECNIGKVAALTAAAENVKYIAKTGYERGKQWGEENNEAGQIGEASELPSTPEIPESDESGAEPEVEGELDGEVEGEVEGELEPEDAVQKGGADEEDAKIESDITQEKTAEEGPDDEEDGVNEDEENFPDLSAMKIPGEFTSATSGNLTSDDTAIPDSALKNIHFLWLYSPSPKILRFTFGRLPSNTTQTCFKDQLKTYLGPIWTQFFTAGAKGLPKPPVSAAASFPDLSPDAYEEEEEEQEDQTQDQDNKDPDATQMDATFDDTQDGGSTILMYH